MKSGLDWRLVHVVNRAGGIDVFWKLFKKPKRINNSILRVLKRSKLMNDVSDHSPNHRLVKVTDLHVGEVRVVSGQRHLAINH